MNFRRLLGARALATCCGLVALSVSGPAFAEVTFKDPLNNQPLAIPSPEGTQRTQAVARFHESGENPHVGNPDAIAGGKRLYAKWCASCHLPNATGRIGPSLVDDEFRYARTDAPVGIFEIIYAGGTGAMQGFGKRMSQDEILQVMAYIESLQKP